MAYTVKKICELSGVTVRTLHYYEEIGLLEPAYYGSNGYRYYGEKELLQLQQILFFKELGLTLKKIQKILGRSDFDQLTALYSHRHALSKEWEKIGKLLKTVDKTINHLTGKKKMKEQEFFDGFTLVQVNPESAAEALVLKNLRKPLRKERDPSLQEKVNQTTGTIFSKIASCIDKGLEPSAQSVQELIKEHQTFSEEFHIATKEVYQALAQLYREHPDFRKQLESFHAQLPEFMSQAMSIYADRELS